MFRLGTDTAKEIMRCICEGFKQHCELIPLGRKASRRGLAPLDSTQEAKRAQHRSTDTPKSMIRYSYHQDHHINPLLAVSGTPLGFETQGLLRTLLTHTSILLFLPHVFSLTIWIMFNRMILSQRFRHRYAEKVNLIRLPKRDPTAV
jgi:hypothetical protein